MSDETTRMVAHAIVALAESAQGLGGALREQIANSAETNRILAAIHTQNSVISEQLEMMNTRHNGSEREIRVLKSDVKEIREDLKRHAERLEAIEPAPGEETQQLG